MTDRPIPYSELATTGRQNLLDLMPVVMPLSMNLEITNICNFRCVSCPQSLPNFKEEVGFHQHMDFELFEKIMHDIRDMGRMKALRLFGYGESITHPDFFRMLKLAKELDVADRMELTSNGARITEKAAGELIEGQLDYLRVSIYALEQEAHRAFTNSKVPIERIRENLQRLRQMRDDAGSVYPHIYVKMLENASPEDEAKLRELYGDIADEIGLEFLHNMTGADGIEERLGVELPKHRQRKVCPSPFYTTSVGANGDVTICCADWNFTSKVGNLATQSLREIWFGEALQDIRRRMLTGQRRTIKSCANCNWDFYHPDNIDGVTPEKAQQVLEFYEPKTETV